MMASARGAIWVWDGAGAKLGLKPGLERQRTGLGCQCDEGVTRGDCRTDARKGNPQVFGVVDCWQGSELGVDVHFACVSA